MKNKAVGSIALLGSIVGIPLSIYFHYESIKEREPTLYSHAFADVLQLQNEYTDISRSKHLDLKCLLLADYLSEQNLPD